MKIDHSLFQKIILVSLVLAHTACQKESDTPASCSPSTATVAGTYKVTALKYKQSQTSTEQDFFELKDACEKDDFVELNLNGTYDYTDAGLACSPDGSNSGTWSISGNTITSDGMANGTIQSFDCRKLVIISGDIIVNGDRLTLTMERQ